MPQRDTAARKLEAVKAASVTLEKERKALEQVIGSMECLERMVRGSVVGFGGKGEFVEWVYGGEEGGERGWAWWEEIVG